MRARWIFLVCLAVPGMLAAAGRTARLTEPKGTISETSPRFVWREVATATQYDLWVVSGDGQQISESVTPATGCVDGLCSFTATQPLDPGPHLWLVLSRIPGSLDRWSSPKNFTVEPDGLRPGKVELKAPSGTLDTTTPSFSWHSAGAGFDYKLVVSGGRPRTIYRQVYDSTVCASGMCTAAPSLTNLVLGDGSYSWTVRASGIVGPGPRSEKMRFNVRTLPSPPEKPTAISPRGRTNETSPTFTWNKTEGATEYYLAVRGREELHGAWYPADATLCPDTTCSIAPSDLVLEHGRYGFKIIAKNAAGESRPSRVMRFRVGDYLSTPVLIAPGGTVGTTPTFQWSAVPNATYYTLRMRTRGTRMATVRFEAQDICDTSTCSAAMNVALDKGTYKWLVVAKSPTTARSNPSATMVFEVVSGGDTPPAIPELISPQGTIDTKTPTFHWNNVPTATSYRLSVKDAFDPILYTHTYSSDAASCSPTTGCRVTPAEMLENGDYSFVVEAINRAGASPESPAKRFTVAAGGGGNPPGTPGIVGPSGTISENMPTFQWKPVDSATSYLLKVKDAFDPVVYSYEYQSGVCGVVCTATPPDTLGDGRYTFFVYAKKGDVSGEPGRGEFTVDTSVTPPATTPLSPTGRITQRNPAFSWTVVDEAVAYTLIVVDATPTERHNVRYELADLTCDASQCQAPSPALDLEDGGYSFTVITEDSVARMTTSAALSFTVAATPTTLRITSHTDGDTLADNGVVVSGTVDSGTVSVTAQLDIDGASVMAARPVEISVNDGWSVFLQPGQLTPGAATLTLVGADSANSTSTLAFNFTVAAFDLKQAMLLSRATFGATPALVDEVKSGGATAFQDRLLNPVPDPTFDAFVASLPTSSDDDVREYALMHALFNPNALQEVMTQFWDNHFSTNMSSHDVPEYELRENNNFRTNALGRFRDLLSISAKSPAMLIYLDLTNNSVVEPNENYSREILELSTMGVDGGYTQNDIEELARILTGWKEVGGNFEFVPSDHDDGTKFFLGVEFPAAAGSTGLAEGELVLDMLSEHRSTAEFICSKLVELLVTENPPAGLVAGCADVFQAEHLNGNPNQIRDVLQFLFDSPDFVDPSNFLAKVKTPLELLAGTVRNLDATVEDRGDLDGDLRSDLDMYLFRHRSPDGFSETADDWIDTSLLLARVDFVNEVARETAARDTYVDIRAYFMDNGLETAEGIAGYLFEIALHNEFTALELSITYDILSGRGTSQFDINGVDAEARLRELVGTVLSFPGYQHQ